MSDEKKSSGMGRRLLDGFIAWHKKNCNCVPVEGTEKHAADKPQEDNETMIDDKKLNDELHKIVKGQKLEDLKAEVAKKSDREKLDYMKSNLENADYQGLALLGFGPPGKILYDELNVDRITTACEKLARVAQNEDDSGLQPTEAILALCITLAAIELAIKDRLGDDKFNNMTNALKMEWMLRKMHKSIVGDDDDKSSE